MVALAGWAFDREAGVASARAALDELVARGLPFCWGVAGRVFDPVEVFNLATWQGLAEGKGLWTDRFVETGRRLVTDLAADAISTDGDPNRHHVATLRRTFNLEGLDPTRPHRFRLPLPVADCALRDVRIEAIDAAGLAWRQAADASRIEVRGVAPAAPTLSIETRVSFTTPGATRDDRSEDVAPYLAPSEDFVQVTPRIRALADALTGLSEPHSIVAAFWDFLLDHMQIGPIHYDQVAQAATALDWALDYGWCDCQVGSALLIALCRARGIPARMVSGHFLYPMAPTYHYWAEIWFEETGWRPFDLLSWTLSQGGRDPAWRRHFAGRLEPRLKTQSLPLRFTGFPGVTFPPAWHVLTRASGAGIEIRFETVATGALIYCDHVVLQDSRRVQPR